MNREELHFAFCFDENYFKYASVCIRSIALFNSNHNCVIHVLSESLSENVIKNLKEASSAPNCRIEIHIIDETILKDLPLGIWPSQAWYRILLPEIISKDVDRILYLDCDTLVMSDLSQLFRVDLSDSSLAALPDPQSFSDSAFQRCGYPKSKKYFCSGIMLLNLDYWRRYDLTEKIIDIALKYKDIVRFPDQDCLNILCQDSKILLPLNYGVMQWYFIDDIRSKVNNQELLACLNDPKIVHFAGCAPWNKALRPSLYSYQWDRINSTLKIKAPVKYNCTKTLLLKKHIYEILHPFQTFKKRRKRLTYSNIIKLMKI